MYRFGSFLFFILSIIGATGQSIKSLSDMGDKAYGREDYLGALGYYKAILKQDSKDAKTLFKVGVTTLSTNRKYDALDYLLKAHELKHDVNPEIDYYLGYAYQVNFKFKEALKNLETFKKKHKKLSAIADQKIEECLLADSLVKRPVATSLKVLDWPINSIYNDYAPLLDSGETTLIFTSARDTTARDVRANNALFESVLFSEKIAGKWTDPSELSSEINSAAHDAATYLSADGKTIVLYYGDSRNLFLSRYTGSGYITDYKNGIWTKPELLDDPINSIGWESSGCYSPDGQFFFFSSDRPGGYGDLDIYMTKLGLDGKWGKPVNLGPEVNTPANEDAPFMHKDGTLYFGSNGHPGLGDYDIYKTKFRGNKWQKPENLGYPVNSPEYDNYFNLSVDKRRGYFTSVRKEGIGNTDIYMAAFPKELNIDSISLAIIMRTDSVMRADSLRTAQMEKENNLELTRDAARVDSLLNNSFIDPSIKSEFSVATEFRGRVIDEEDGSPIKAQIVLIDNKTNKLLTRAYSNPKNGIFVIVIPHGGNYGVSASCDGYLFNSMNFDVPAFAESQTIETAIIMSRAQVGAKSTLKNIFFDTGKSDLKKESIGELEQLVTLLSRNPKLRVQINGHTDSAGDNYTNQVLSLKRAQSVVDHLITKGIDTSRLKAVGYGEERPIVSNDDEQEGREINRRTEIEVVEVTQ